MSLQQLIPLGCDSQHQHNQGEVGQLFRAESFGHRYPYPLYQATDSTEVPHYTGTQAYKHTGN